MKLPALSIDFLQQAPGRAKQSRSKGANRGGWAPMADSPKDGSGYWVINMVINGDFFGKIHKNPIISWENPKNHQ